MKFCTNCGAQLNETAAFCTSCGTKINVTAQPVQVATPPVYQPTAPPQQVAAPQVPQQQYAGTPQTMNQQSAAPQIQHQNVVPPQPVAAPVYQQPVQQVPQQPQYQQPVQQTPQPPQYQQQQPPQYRQPVQQAPQTPQYQQPAQQIPQPPQYQQQPPQYQQPVQQMPQPPQYQQQPQGAIMQKQQILYNAPYALNNPNQPWEVAVEGNNLVARWRWMDARFFSPHEVNNQTRDYSFTVTLLDNNTWKEQDVTSQKKSGVSMSGGGLSFGSSKNTFKGKTNQKSFSLGAGQNNQTGEAGIVSFKFDTSAVKLPIRNYLTSCGWKPAGMFS